MTLQQLQKKSEKIAKRAEGRVRLRAVTATLSSHCATCSLPRPLVNGALCAECYAWRQVYGYGRPTDEHA